MSVILTYDITYTIALYIILIAFNSFFMFKKIPIFAIPLSIFSIGYSILTPVIMYDIVFVLIALTVLTGIGDLIVNLLEIRRIR